MEGGKQIIFTDLFFLTFFSFVIPVVLFTVRFFVVSFPAI